MVMMATLFGGHGYDWYIGVMLPGYLRKSSDISELLLEAATTNNIHTNEPSASTITF